MQYTCLFITTSDPIHGKGGEHLRTRSALQIISNFAKIHLLTETYSTTIDQCLMANFEEKVAPLDLRMWSDECGENLPGPRRSLVDRIPKVRAFTRHFSRLFRIDPSFLSRIQRAAGSPPADFAWIDTDGFLGQYVEPLKKLGMKVFYNTQNVQPELNFQIAQLSGSRGFSDNLRNRFVRALEKRHERRYFKKLDYIFSCNRNELGYYEDLLGDKAAYYPNVAPGAEKAITHPLPDKYILWAGSMSVPFHREGIVWFLKEVWEDLSHRHPDIHFVIAGRLHEEIGKFQDDLSRSDRIHLISNPKSMTEIFGNAELLIVPLFSGSGSCIKVLVALGHGVPVVASPNVLSAFPLSEDSGALPAKDKNEFLEKIGYVLDHEEFREQTRRSGPETVHNDFSNESVLPWLKKLIVQELASRPSTLP